MAINSQQPTTVYLIYAQKDEAFKQDFEDYLILLQQAQLVSGWTERKVQRGGDWSKIIDPQVHLANFFVLLVSPSLLASGYYSGVEFQEILKRWGKQKARLIPIILHTVDLTHYSPLQSIVSLPRGWRPLSSWANQSEAWSSIYQEMVSLIQRH